MIVVGSGKKIEFGSEAAMGDLITLLAAMLWALNTSVQKPLVARYPSTQVALVSVGVGALVLPLVGAPAMATMDWGGVFALALHRGDCVGRVVHRLGERDLVARGEEDRACADGELQQSRPRARVCCLLLFSQGKIRPAPNHRRRRHHLRRLAGAVVGNQHHPAREKRFAKRVRFVEYRSGVFCDENTSFSPR
jgi:hypothetical protein